MLLIFTLSTSILPISGLSISSKRVSTRRIVDFPDPVQPTIPTFC